MKKKEYKKTYAGLIWWMIAIFVFCVTAFLWIGLLPAWISNKIINIIIMLFVDALMFMIYKGQHIYWFTGGPSFEMAKDAGYEKRRRYAWDVLKPFLLWSGVFLVYMVFSTIFHWHFGIDTGVFLIAMVTAGLSSINVKL